MRLPGAHVTEVYWAEETGSGIWKGGDNSQEGEMSRCLVNKCSPGHADKSF